jgi:shikimate kinase
VLVGLSGSGKTAAGRLAADTLAVPFHDIDALIEEREAVSIAHIFAERGEPAFRELERAAVREALAAEPAVIAPGGGWVAQPGNVEDAGESAILVYLRVSPEVAAARVASQGNRPLLEGGDPTRRLRQLLAERETAYLGAERVVETDAMTVAEVAAELVVLARSTAGW